MNDDTRDRIRSGDLLVWSKPSGTSGGIWLNMVRFLTVSDFGHVSIAWRQGDELFHIEAVMPRIRVAKVPKNIDFFIVPMSEVIENSDDMQFFNDKIGAKYSIFDAVRAYMGMPTIADNRWQCAELTASFYREKGIDINLRFATPTRLVRELMMMTGIGLYKVNRVS